MPATTCNGDAAGYLVNIAGVERRFVPNDDRRSQKTVANNLSRRRPAGANCRSSLKIPEAGAAVLSTCSNLNLSDHAIAGRQIS